MPAILANVCAVVCACRVWSRLTLEDRWVSSSPSLPQSDAFIPGEGRKGEERSENVGWKGRERDGGKLVGIVGVREIAFRSPRRRGREKLDNTRRDGPHPPTPPRSDGRGEKFGL